MEKILFEIPDSQQHPDPEPQIPDSIKFFQNLPAMDLMNLSLQDYDKNFQVLISTFPNTEEIDLDFSSEMKIVEKIEEKVSVKWTDKNKEDLENIQKTLNNEEKVLEKIKKEKTAKNEGNLKVFNEKLREIEDCELEIRQLTEEIRRIEECRNTGFSNVSGYGQFLCDLGVELSKSGEGFLVKCGDDQTEIDLTQGSRYRMRNKGKTFMYGNSEYVYPAELASHFSKLISKDN